ncbi:STAS domain-containing protein [Pseudoflavonifractor sp. An85]|uniref:STAS domain-containing protein n=1 Tax=Pseudoflavonifractor sp. An85 TaxID=1965661 RepID=UPI000B38825B|nr:STAS domain-containing protein [Pseudoflavonifractor sp. An85]OUN22756.1 sulfate transporter [Pseudoflavonifractor sp. An85]
MPITIDKQNGATVISIRGEVDHHSARTIMENIDQTISSTLPMRLVLDLSSVTFMDSSGIAVLLRALRQMEQLGGSLRVVGIPPQPRRVLEAAGIGRIITLE